MQQQFVGWLRVLFNTSMWHAPHTGDLSRCWVSARLHRLPFVRNLWIDPHMAQRNPFGPINKLCQKQRNLVTIWLELEGSPRRGEWRGRELAALPVATASRCIGVARRDELPEKAKNFNWKSVECGKCADLWLEREIEKEGVGRGFEEGAGEGKDVFTIHKSIVYPSQSAAGHRFCLN